MPATGSASIQSILRYPLIAGRISRLGPVHQVLSNFYGAGLKSSGGVVQGGTKRSAKRDLVYDQFDTSRRAASIRPPGTGPYRRTRDPIGKASAFGLRSFAAMDFTYEDLRDMRPQGSPPGTVDSMGKRYIADQTDNLIREAFTLREWAFVSMLKGNLYLKKDGEEFRPLATSTGSHMTVDYKVPTAHKGQLPLGTIADPTDGDLVSASWDNSATDILAQLMAIFQAGIRVSGYPMTEVWMNSNTWVHLMNNDTLQDQGGSAFRVWAEQKYNEVKSAGAKEPDLPAPYFTYQLRATGGQFNFHVYDGGLNLDVDINTSSSTPPGTAYSEWTSFIPNNQVLITPSPAYRDWYDIFEIMETVKERYDDKPKEVYGFHSWGMEEFNHGVPKHVFYQLDNFCPALTVPNAVMTPTVVF